MRYLTVKRNKAFASSLVKMRVYIEDPSATDILINGTPCRKLGELKNGTEDTYQIGDCAANLYVAGEKYGSINKDTCYPIPEGTEDITVSGENILDFFKDNPFIFDDIGDPMDPLERKKSVNKGKIIVLCITIATAILSRALLSLPALVSESGPKTFTVENMEITLTKGFKELNMDGYIKVYDSSNIGAAVSNELFSEYPVLETYTLDGYGELLKEVNPDFDMTSGKQDGLTYLEYTAEGEEKKTYHYWMFLFKTDEGFWVVEFWTFEKSAEKLEPKIFEYAKSVKFS